MLFIQQELANSQKDCCYTQILKTLFHYPQKSQILNFALDNSFHGYNSDNHIDI